MKTVLYAAAHGGFQMDKVALGGGGMICAQLERAWNATASFEHTVLAPDLLGRDAPKNDDLIRYSTSAYANFCRRFERALDQKISTYDPSSVSILCNDISEGPPFESLARRGYALHTIFHVDVVDYVARVYGREFLPARGLARGYAGLRTVGLHHLLPSILRLIFEKQHQAVHFSKSLIVPSQPMKDVIQACYPSIDSQKIQVIPWGIWDGTEPSPKTTDRLRRRFAIDVSSMVFLTLSRISPEKGQDRLIEAMRLWEKRPSFPKMGVTLVICGAPAYMHGETFFRKLKKQAAELKRTRVVFPGYVHGEEKQSWFSLASAYVFPSRHESYGLTLLEALQAGLPAITTAHHGSAGLGVEAGVEVLPNGSDPQVSLSLVEACERLVSNPQALAVRREQAKRYASSHRFEAAVEAVSRLLQAE